ncbi:MAG: methionine--tRNA ligase [Methanobacteriota archaeon]|uniref:Methionine--tRNA ligase n=1 Tax=Marine Group III euryarchaeote TaxID=2173149 RepID=A0A7C8DJR8_9ARCH|nr:MAG: methionine--tRNA ligase [Euryarchaeota archaeon]HIG62929.1 methionine--tRNA ligase [Marine Group III euryarchaeote]HIL33574.1 methionine--tRNA ligase [Candidatus Poseidoniales archaeon]
MKHILVAVAWPYANGPLHLGHMAGCYLPADIFARYHRLKGNRVLMVSGSDMHGTPIMVTAQQEGAKPEEVALRYHKIITSSLEEMGISFDLFTHTHTPEHEAVVHEILGRLDEAGFIEPRTTTAPYDPKAGQFLPDRYVEGTCPHCKSTGARGDQCDECGKPLDADELIDPHPKLNPEVALEFRETEHLFFRLSAFREQLLEWLSEGKGHWKSNVLKFTRNWLEEGLEDRAITRDLEWGVPVPRDGYESKRVYVWFEAVMGYYSASRHWAQLQGEPEEWRKWWDDPEAEHRYFMAKDNIPFHTIIWPATLLGCGMQLPHDVPANEYLLLDSAQFSKSRRHAVWIPDYLERYDSEALRYYLAAVMPEQKDANFSWEDYVTRVNTELIGNLGNLLHRVVSFAQKNFPDGLHTDECALPELRDRVATAHAKMDAALAACKFKRGLAALLELSQATNAALNAAAPWKLLKQDRAACEAQLVGFLNVCRALSIMMTPFLPRTGETAWRYLGQPGTPQAVGWEAALEGATDFTLQRPEPLFAKLDLKQVLEKEMPQNELPELKPEISFDDFKKLDIRVGTVVGVEKHPDADKLWLLDVDFGGPTRRLVTGLRGVYEADELQGRQIAVLVNLQRAKFRGVESEGMLLAAESGKMVSLLQPDQQVENGSRIH